MATEFPIRANTSEAVIDINSLITALRKTGKEAGLTDKRIEEMVQEVKKAGKEGTQQVNNINKSFDSLLNGSLKKVGTAIAAAFAAQQLLNFANNLISVTAEFQKLEAVLTNTLGSKSKARLAMQEIVQFASQTPFSVKELTESFVKLANQGFVPTREEMRRLGDLAASTGKSFDQLTEGIIDAQTGEFERLKDFGIRASKQGDQVIFTFKGVKTQVDFTSESIRNYILSLGDLEGVSGATASISETLAGQISNLGDNLNSFFDNLGKYNSGPIGAFFRLINDGLTEINKSMALANMTAGDLAEVPLKRFREAYDAAKKEVEDTGSFQKLNQLYIDLTEAINSANEDIAENQELLNNVPESMRNSAYVKQLKNQGDVYRAEVDGYKEIRSDLQKIVEEAQTRQSVSQKGIIESLEDQLKKLKKAREEATTTSEITRLDGRIQEVSRHLKILNDDLVVTFTSKEVEKGISDLDKKLEDTLDKNVEKATDKFKIQMKERSEAFEQSEEERNRIAREKAKARAEAEKYAQDTILAAGESFLNSEVEQVQRQMDALQAQRDRELELAGDNAEARAAINKRFDEQQRQLQSKQAQREQNLAVFEMIINQGPAIAKTAKNLGYPLAIPFITAIAYLFSRQLNSVKAAQVPKFKDGVYDLDGPGTTTSDSIPAWLSRGESVVDAESTRKFGFLLKPIIENKTLDVWDIKNIIDQKLPTQYRNVLLTSSGADSAELVQEVRATREALKNLKQINVAIDENGFSTFVKDQNYTIRKLNKRYPG